MMKKLVAIVLLLFVLFFPSCITKPHSYAALDSIPHQYTLTQAKKNKDVINYKAKRYNISLLNSFYNEIQKSKNATVRVTIFTQEGGVIILDLVNKDRVLTLTLDNTRDTYSDHKITTYDVRQINKTQLPNHVSYTAILENGESFYII